MKEHDDDHDDHDHQDTKASETAPAKASLNYWSCNRSRRIVMMTTVMMIVMVMVKVMTMLMMLIMMVISGYCFLLALCFLRLVLVLLI